MQIELHSTNFKLRPVRESDASDIIKLRRAPGNAKYINKTSENIDAQINYIRTTNNKTDDHFFAVENRSTAEFFGTVAIYDIKVVNGQTSGEWGRFILWPHLCVAIETCALIYKFAFEHLNMDRVYCRTVAENKAVVSLHDSIGLTRTVVLPAHFNGMNSIEHELTSSKYPLIAENLKSYIARANSLIR